MAINDEAALVSYKQEWLYDYIIQFLRSPGWRVPILTFIDEYCVLFDNSDENKFVYSDIHEEFKKMIDVLLENLTLEINITSELFVKAIAMGLKNKQHRRIFEQIIACDNFLSFKKLMIKRNNELEQEALHALNAEESKHGPSPPMVEGAATGGYAGSREQTELEHAIAMSLALEAEKMRLMQSEDDELQRAIKLSQLEHEQFLAKQREQELKQRELELAERERITLLQRQEEEKQQKWNEERRRKFEEDKRRQEEEEKRIEEETRKRQADQEYKQREEAIKRKLQEEQARLEADRLEQQRRLQAMNEEELRKREEERRAIQELNQKRLASLQKLKNSTASTEEEIYKEQQEAWTSNAALRARAQMQPLDAARGTIDVSAQRSEAEDLRKQAEDIVRQNTGNDDAGPMRAESLAERQARLKRQRDMILAKKRAEREREMKDYLDGGGVDLTVKREGAAEDDAALERRRQIAAKLKSTMAN